MAVQVMKEGLAGQGLMAAVVSFSVILGSWPAVQLTKLTITLYIHYFTSGMLANSVHMFFFLC